MPFITRGKTNWKFLLIVVVLAVVAGGIIWWYQNSITKVEGSTPIKEIKSFEECIASGYPVLESYPRQCKTPDGKTFFEEILPENETTNWKVYKNEEYGFEFKYKDGRIREFTSQSESQNLFRAITQLDFGEYYIAFGGIPVGHPGITDLEVKEDQVLIGDKLLTRKFWHSSSSQLDFASILLDYPNQTYPYFLIYHSTNLEDLEIINQILSTFRFIEPVESGKPVETCKDNCGNGICEEVVCLAIGCPCAETPENCPQDCRIEIPKIEIKNFTTDKKTYTSNEDLKAYLTVFSSGETKGVTIKLTGIKPHNYAYINSSQTVDLNSGENKITFTEKTPYCTSGCGGVYPGPYDLTAEIFINENLVASSTTSINLTNK